MLLQRTEANQLVQPTLLVPNFNSTLDRIVTPKIFHPS
jgi:hypothetical protein